MRLPAFPLLKDAFLEPLGDGASWTVLSSELGDLGQLGGCLGARIKELEPTWGRKELGDLEQLCP